VQYDICSVISFTRVDAVNENKIIEICRITKKGFEEYQIFFLLFFMIVKNRTPQMFPQSLLAS
jgi:hypothetical protein